MVANESVIETAHAKANLFLNVLGKRPDGFHDLEMFNVTLELGDTLVLSRSDEPGIRIRSNDRFLENGDNLLTRVAAATLAGREVASGVLVEVAKRIPVGAGLGGNSADAAAVIRGLDRLFHLGLSHEEMLAIGRQHGADIPYCIVGGPALVRGIGERIEPRDLDFSEWSVLVANPGVYVATATAFAMWDDHGGSQVPDAAFLAALATGDIPKLVASMQNALEPATFAIAPEVARWKKKIIDELGPDGIVMTGSGSTILKVYRGFSHNIARFVAENGSKSPIFITTFTNKATASL